MGDLGSNILSSSIALLILLAIMGIAYTVWSQINMRKKRDYFKKLHEEIAPGKEVMFSGGIFGTVKRVSGDRVTVTTRSGAELDVSRYAIQQLD
ncbi:preprotein translocase subunit YajC [Collinsella sp. AGMB00827]|uniref:Preprotein translocase subunit YajC n=1 Tax=Collinsella ureilytica TaxID=2869515 RepID=A0ABS7MJC4_9ACTN|nr:preprotein translocase subunit YajC [Collinsella urealyticum]MBY4797475.1 preprotein translocase subunit YajC [Collinsella urealyticum]